MSLKRVLPAAPQPEKLAHKLRRLLTERKDEEERQLKEAVDTVLKEDSKFMQDLMRVATQETIEKRRESLYLKIFLTDNTGSILKDSTYDVVDPNVYSTYAFSLSCDAGSSLIHCEQDKNFFWIGKECVEAKNYDFFLTPLQEATGFKIGHKHRHAKSNMFVFRLDW